MGIFLALESYRLERLAVWKNPEAYEKGISDSAGIVCNWEWEDYLEEGWDRVFKAWLCTGSPK